METSPPNPGKLSTPHPKPVRLVRTLPYAPEVVWDALTDRQRLAEWMGDNDFAPRVGHAFELRVGPRPGWDGVLRCRVLEMDPPRRLAFSCASGHARRGTVTISLAKVPEGTRLVLEHEGLGERGRELFAILLPPAWGAPAWGARRGPAIGGAALLAVGLAAVVAFAMRGATEPGAGGMGGAASGRCEHSQDPAPPAQDDPPPMVLAARRAR
jgi:uncharacterized protein YndB with AHSA1/START domain